MIYLELLNEIVENCYLLLTEMTDDELRNKKEVGKWSAIEIIGHLTDSAFNNHRRIMLYQNQDNLLFDGYNQDQWVKRNAYQDRNCREIIDLWKLSNKQVYYVAKTLPESKMKAKTTVHKYFGWSMIPFQEGKAESLEYLIKDYVYHLEHHLVQIFPNYQRKVSYNEEGYQLGA